MSKYIALLISAGLLFFDGLPRFIGVGSICFVLGMMATVFLLAEAFANENDPSWTMTVLRMRGAIERRRAARRKKELKIRMKSVSNDA